MGSDCDRWCHYRNNAELFRDFLDKTWVVMNLPQFNGLDLPRIGRHSRAILSSLTMPIPDKFV